MKKEYDVIVVGGSSMGSYFAKKMSRRGYSVLLTEKEKREDISRGYDIFHMIKHEIRDFGDLPAIEPGDGVWAFEYSDSYTFSPYGRHPKHSGQTVVGMHRHEYMLRCLDDAAENGVDILYEAEYKAPVIEGGKLRGIRFERGGEMTECRCRLVADCSGQGARVRLSLPEDYGADTRALTPEELFFVKLLYIRFNEPLEEKWLRSQFYMYYKTWLSPAGDAADCILGAGVFNSFAEADRVTELFLRNVPVPPFTVVREETGTTPYTYPLYSFVADGFIALGDAAAVTKANNGEGCTVQLPLADIAAEIASQVMTGGRYPTKEALWPINRLYYKGQGKDQALMLAALTKGLRHSIETNEYLFEKDIIFNEKIICEGPEPQPLTATDVLKMLGGIAAGIAGKKIKAGEMAEMLSGGLKGLKIMLHYGRYPDKPSGFGRWKAKADRLWKKTGRMSDGGNPTG